MTDITDESVRTTPRAPRQRTLRETLRRQWRRRRKLYGRGWGELHRLLNNRIGSLSAIDKKNAEANDRAYNMNQKRTQALATLAEEYGTFEATVKKVTFEHAEGGVLHAVASEVADELD